MPTKLLTVPQRSYQNATLSRPRARHTPPPAPRGRRRAPALVEEYAGEEDEQHDEQQQDVDGDHGVLAGGVEQVGERLQVARVGGAVHGPTAVRGQPADLALVQPQSGAGEGGGGREVSTRQNFRRGGLQEKKMPVKCKISN